VTTLDLLTGALAVFTLLLFGATVYMGKEMRATRRLSIQPQLVLALTMISKMVAAPALTNIGSGPAVDVELKIVYTPTADDDDVTRGWSTRLIVPGKRHVFMPPLNAHGQAPGFEEFAGAYRAIRVVGTYRDRFGAEHELEEHVSDVAAAQRLGAEAMHLFEADAVERAADQLNEPLKKVAQSLERLAGQAEQTNGRAPALARLRRAARHLVGLPDIAASGFVADVWWGPESHAREQRRKRVARLWIGRLVQRWLA